MTKEIQPLIVWVLAITAAIMITFASKENWVVSIAMCILPIYTILATEYVYNKEIKKGGKP